MKALRQLRTEIVRNPENKKAIISQFLNDYPSLDECALVAIIQDLKWSAIVSILHLYIEEKESRSVYDIVVNNDASLFDFEGETYQYLGKEDGVAKFKKLGSPDIIKPPFELTDKVTRIF
jgi:hypothetical protein